MRCGIQPCAAAPHAPLGFGNRRHPTTARGLLRSVSLARSARRGLSRASRASKVAEEDTPIDSSPSLDSMRMSEFRNTSCWNDSASTTEPPVRSIAGRISARPTWSRAHANTSRVWPCPTSCVARPCGWHRRRRGRSWRRHYRRNEFILHMKKRGAQKASHTHVHDALKTTSEHTTQHNAPRSASSPSCRRGRRPS